MNVKRVRQVLLSIGAIVLLSKGTSTLRSYLLQFLSSSRKQTIAESPWKLFSELLRDIKDKRVDKVLVAPNHCVVIANNSSYRVQLPPRTTTTYVTNLLAESDVHFGALQPPSSTRLLPMLMTILPFAYLGLTYFMLRKLFSDGKGVGKSSGRNKRLHPDGRTSQHISFSDVAGIDSARRELEEVVDFLRNPTKYTSMGARVPKGVLLCGPSGTGKTLLARAVASEANVAFLFCSASDFVEMLVGRGAARVRDLFTQASQHRKCIIFIDEIDALAKARGGLNSNDEREQTLNQLLTEMDGFDTFQHQSASDEDEDSTVLVIAATNRPEVLDAALLRPGRFDRHVHVGLPDLDGREEILKVHCRGVKVAPEVDLRQVARRCAEGNQRSGAQLASVVNEAAMLAVRNEVEQVDMRCFDEAIRKAGAMTWTSGDLEEIYD